MAGLTLRKKMMLVTYLMLEMDLMEDIIIMLIFLAVAYLAKNEDGSDGDEDSDGGSEGFQVVGEGGPAAPTNAEFDASASKPPSQHDHSEKSVNSKKRSRSGEEFGDLVQKIRGFIGAYKERNEHWKRIADYFRLLSDKKERRTELVKAIMQLTEFTKQERFRVGGHILKDPAKIDFFFSLPEELRSEYVQEQLGECTPYRPSFDFSGDN